MSKFCSNCGAQITGAGDFCSACGGAVSESAMSGMASTEKPSSEHIAAFSKWFKLSCIAFAVGVVAAFIGLGTAFMYAAQAGGQIETLVTVFLAGSVIAVIASIILICLTANIRLKPQVTRTMLRFGTRFAELSLSCMNVALALALATCYTFNNYFGSDTMFAVYITGAAAVFVVVIECGVSFIKSKYKSDKNYSVESTQKKTK